MTQEIKMKSFVAIDFETANQYRSSVCSVGVVVVKDNKIIDKFYSLTKVSQVDQSMFYLVGGQCFESVFLD